MIYAVIFLVILILNILLWILIIPRLLERHVARFQNDLVTRHFDEVETMYRKMRGWRHDYHNHIQVLKAHMSLAQYGQAEEYLDKLDDDLTNVDTVLKTGNVMVDAILNSKLTLIKEKKIAVDATAIVPQNIEISGIDLSALIGNLLDNAMEACMRINDENERFIRIYIDIIKKQLYISVTNSMEIKGWQPGNIFKSSKIGNHGLGLHRIESIVSKYNGFLNRQTEKGVFATEIMLPLVKQ